MNKELDEVLLEMSKRDRIAETFMSLGASHEQAEVAANTKNVVNQFDWNGATLTFQKKPLYKRDDGALVKAWVQENKYDFLLPLAEADPVKRLNIAPALIESAKAGNWTSIGALARLLGSREAAEALIAEKVGDKTGDIGVVDDKTQAPVKVPALKGATNPWTPDCTDAAGRPAWSAAARRRQSDTVKSLGPAVSASIAKSANPPAFLGSPRPGATNLTSSRRSA
jgi:hypothetical protein